MFLSRSGFRLFKLSAPNEQYIITFLSNMFHHILLVEDPFLRSY